MAILSEIDCTPLLASRPSRPADHARENEALQRLGGELANPGGNVLAALAQAALELCDADSAGISILEPDGAQPMFRWHAIRGAWAKYEGQGLPRDESPCGVTVARNETCLMRRPERCFPAVLGADPRIAEVLLTPFLILGEPLGTVWVIFHEEGEPRRQFDREHARTIESLARFASNAFLLQEQARHATEARDEIFRVNRRLTKILTNMGASAENIAV